ncbi:hypothetical protein GGI17_003089 [Coemansia sp. S146]|nr:hypothetical protein GGI17_003089 [Coemansia sp. S146]
MYSSTIATLLIGALAICASAMPNPISGPVPIPMPNAAAIAMPDAAPIAVPDGELTLNDVAFISVHDGAQDV